MTGDLTPCNRRGREVRTEVFECFSNRLLHPEPGVVSARTCDICPYRNFPDRPAIGPDVDSRPSPLTVSCRHRGDVVAIDVCTACGMRGQAFEVHACDLHQLCMLRRYRADRPQLTVCFNCVDYEPAWTE